MFKQMCNWSLSNVPHPITNNNLLSFCCNLCLNGIVQTFKKCKHLCIIFAYNILLTLITSQYWNLWVLLFWWPFELRFTEKMIISKWNWNVISIEQSFITLVRKQKHQILLLKKKSNKILVKMNLPDLLSDFVFTEK